MKKTIKDAISEFNIGIQTIVEYLNTHSINVKQSPNVKLSDIEYELIVRKFQIEKSLKDEAINLKRHKSKSTKISIRTDQCESEKKKRLLWVKYKINDLKTKNIKKDKKQKTIKGYEETIKEFEINRKYYKVESQGKSIHPILTPMKG